MDLFTIGFPVAFSLQNLVFCFLGVFVGTAVGALPGIGPLAAIAMLLPITFHMEPVSALILLSGIYYGTEYGGSIASILLNVPGHAANAVTTLDGYPMAREGRAGVALLVTAVSSFIGGIIGIVVLMLLTPLIIQVALSFGPAEYFALMLLGLLATAGIGSSGPVKGLASIVIGLMVGCVGIDVNSGTARYGFGFFELYEGISVVVLAIGLFGVTEIIASVATSHQIYRGKLTLRSMVPTRDDVRRSVAPTFRGSGIGSFFGALPGAGPMLAAFFAYLVEKRVARQPERFGKGAIEGVAAPEAANNAAAQTAFVPTLTMGIPGSTTMAVILGAMMIHGIVPGPLMITEHPDVFWGLIASFWIGNVLLLVLNIPLVGLWVRILQVPYHLLYPVIVVLICFGVFSVNNSVFDIALVLVIGFVGYGLRLMGIQPAPILLAFILGPMMEVNFRRALLLSHGDYMALFKSPIAGPILAASILILVWMIWNTFSRRPEANPGQT